MTGAGPRARARASELAVPRGIPLPAGSVPAFVAPFEVPTEPDAHTKPDGTPVISECGPRSNVTVTSPLPPPVGAEGSSSSDSTSL